MSIFESIVNQFNNHLEITSNHIEALTPGIAEAIHLFTETLLTGKKILCCTSNECFSSGWQFSYNLANSMELQRPSLPVIFMGNHSNMASFSNDQQGNNFYIKLIQSIGDKDDILFVISRNSNENFLVDAIAAAHEKQMSVIALIPNKNNELTFSMQHSDVIIQTGYGSIQQILAVQYLVCLSLSELIEQQLFGTEQL